MDSVEIGTNIWNNTQHFTSGYINQMPYRGQNSDICLILPLDAGAILRSETEKMQHARVYILLGSNRGEREGMLAQAVRLISERAGKIRAVSRVYETQPWGFGDAHPFLNQVLEIETTLTPAALLGSLLSIESEMGRIRSQVSSGGYLPRLIDIDILMYDDLILESPDLIVPHPRMHQRMFTLRPLAEIAPNVLHPVLGRSIAELEMECSDQLIVKPLYERKPGV